MKDLIKALIRLTYPFGIPLVLNREELPFILNRRRLLGEGAEVGVQRAIFSKHILSHWKGRLLHSVDPWSEYPGDANPDSANVPQDEQESVCQDARARLAAFGERSKIWRLASAEAGGRFADGQLDFVYLDALHDYEYVKEDLHCWHPKVRPGGILAGHDYTHEKSGIAGFGVKQAVDEFCRERGYKASISIREGVYKSWFIILPKRRG